MSTELFLLIAISLIVLLLLLELRQTSFREALWSDRTRAARNWSFLLATVITMACIHTATRFIADGVPSLLAYPGPLVAVDFLGVFLVAELFNWVCHYVKHQQRMLWRFHFMHHRETNYTVWLTTHVHGLEVLVSGCVLSSLLTFLGFSLLSTQVYFLFYMAVNTYQHSANGYSLGFLDRIIVGPRYHHLHHEIRMKGNFGSTLTFWDLVFRTAHWPEPQRTKRRVGIRENGEPWGFWKEFTYFLKRTERTQRLPVAPISKPVASRTEA